jgi:reactive intermediate/imine deaminase
VKDVISTAFAPQAIGTYSQAIKVGSTIYLSGQIPLVPETGQLCDGDFTARVELVITNIKAVAEAAGGDLNHIVKLNVFLTDLSQFEAVNDVMSNLWPAPYPARAMVEVRALPKGVDVEMDAIMVLDQ